MNDKKCKNCNRILPLENFYKQKQGKWDYLDSLCIDCRKEYSLNRRRKIKLQAIEYLGGKCKLCGLVDEPEVYDFHHLDRSMKDFSLGKVGGLSFESIKDELEKCVLLCANCHRKVENKLHFGIDLLNP